MTPEKTIWTTAEIIREANYTWSDNDVLLVKNNKKWISADKVKELEEVFKIIKKLKNPYPIMKIFWNRPMIILLFLWIGVRIVVVATR